MGCPDDVSAIVGGELFRRFNRKGFISDRRGIFRSPVTASRCRGRPSLSDSSLRGYPAVAELGEVCACQSVMSLPATCIQLHRCVNLALSLSFLLNKHHKLSFLKQLEFKSEHRSAGPLL